MAAFLKGFPPWGAGPVPAGWVGRGPSHKVTVGRAISGMISVDWASRGATQAGAMGQCPSRPSNPTTAHVPMSKGSMSSISTAVGHRASLRVAAQPQIQPDGCPEYHSLLAF